MLKGASSESAAAIIEAFASLFWGLVLAFIYSWPIAVSGLVVAPVMMVGTAINQKAENEMYFEGADTAKDLDKTKMKANEQSTKAAQVLLSDAIANYKTVASLGNDNIIIDEFAGHLEKRLIIEKKNGCIFGFSWGFA